MGATISTPRWADGQAVLVSARSGERQSFGRSVTATGEHIVLLVQHLEPDHAVRAVGARPRTCSPASLSPPLSSEASRSATPDEALSAEMTIPSESSAPGPLRGNWSGEGAVRITMSVLLS